MTAFDDETLAKLEKKLIAAGYTDGDWRSIIFKYYGEDYEGMAERARLRAEERERRKLTMVVTKEMEDLGPQGASKMEPAARGTTQMLMTHGPGLEEYFPHPPIPPVDRSFSFGILPPTEPIAHTIGTGAPGKGGIFSKGTVDLSRPVKEGEEEESGDKPAQEGGDEPTEAAAGGEGAVGAEEELDEDELMFIWNRREAPQYRRSKIDAARSEKLDVTDKVQAQLEDAFVRAAEEDKAFWATVGVSEQHPTGTLAWGQFNHFMPQLEQKPTATVMEGLHQTARWNLEAPEEDLQPDARDALLPLGGSNLEGVEELAREHGLVQTRARLLQDEAALERQSLGASKLEMPPDADPHYMESTVFKAAHAMKAATQSPRVPVEQRATEAAEIEEALTTLQREMGERVEQVQAKLKGIVIKDMGENLDIPAILLRKFNYLQNPRFRPKVQNFRAILDTVLQSAEALQPAEDGSLRTIYAGEKSFFPQPSVVHFAEYEVGEVHEISVRMYNCARILQRCRVLPPASQHFSVSLTRYPGEDGLVAPGMFCEFTVRFLPDTLADYEEVLHVATEHGVLSIPLLARRLPPNLTIPDVVDVGNCFIDDRRTVVLPCKNEGGRGRFILVPDSEWPEPPEDIAGREGASLPPFHVSPSQWELGPGESIEVTIEFAPGEAGETARGFRLVCDNCSVHAYSLRGHALAPALKLEAIDALSIPPPLADEPHPATALAFAPIAPGASETKALALRNRTPLGMAYYWEVVHEDSPHTAAESYVARHGRVGRDHAVFTVSPTEGEVTPGGALVPRVTFTPRGAVLYHATARLVARQLPAPERAPAGGGAVPPALLAPGFGAAGFAYRDAELARIDLRGFGSEVRVSVVPQVLMVAERLSLGQTYHRPLTVRNESAAPTELAWERYPDMLYQAVRVVPDRVRLGPNEERTLRVEIRPKVVAPLEVSLGCDILHAPPQSIAVTAQVDGPRTRILESQVDFGLVRMGDSVQRGVTVCNVCDVTANWTATLTDAATGVRMGAAMLVSPATGHLEPGGRAALTVRFTPEAPQRTRCVLALEVEAGETQYVSLRGEVVYARVSLSEPTIDLGTIFLAVPVTRRIRMRNLTLLPSTKYRWDSGAVADLKKPSSAAFTVEVDRVEGDLGPNEEAGVTLRVEAHDVGVAEGVQTRRAEQLGSAANPGTLAALLPLDVEGMPLPAGLELRAKVMGLAVTYHVGALHTLEPVPDEIKGTPAALAVGVQTDWAPHLLGPDTDAPIVLDFGHRAALEKQSVTFVIRNHTGIPSSYTLAFEEFGVPAHEMLFAEAQAEAQAHTGNLERQGTGDTRTRGTARSRERSATAMSQSATGDTRQSSPLGSLRSGRRSAAQTAASPRSRGLRTAPLLQTQSGVSVGSVPPRRSGKLTRQQGTVASVRMGATLERAVATGVAGRCVTKAEERIRRNRGRAPLLQDATAQLGSALRTGHAQQQLSQLASMHAENRRLQQTSLWCLPGDHTSAASRGHSAGGLKPSRLILSDEHEDVERFRSFHGQGLLNRRNEAQEAQQLLDSGAGVALTASSYAGPIPAWGEVEVRVDLYSDMCGVFRDRLVVQVQGLPQAVIPVVGKVTGAPVRLEGGTLGLNLVGETPSLDFGDVLVKGPPQNRALRVANYSPWPMQVAWRLLQGAPPSGQNLVALASTVAPDGRVSYAVTAVEPPEALEGETPFVLERGALVVPPHKTKALNVTCRCDVPQHHSNFLVGDVCVLPKDATMPGEETAADRGKVDAPLELVDWEEADVALLQSELTGHRLVSMEPIVVAMRCEATSARLETDSSKHLKWICSTSHDHKHHPSYVKEINLSNRGRCNQTFSLSVTPPFSIDSTSCTAPIHPLAPAPLADGTATQRAQMFTLPPNDTVAVRVRFNLPAKHRTARTVDDALCFGELRATFENEETQVMGLEAHIVHPSLLVAPSELNFRTLHVESRARVTICLTNAAYADASWSIEHAPRLTTLTTSLTSGARSGTLAGTAKPAGPEDDAECFSFHPPSGFVQGTRNRPTRPATQIVTVEFHPKKNVPYRSRFKVEVESGRYEYLYLEGVGSYDENQEPGGSTGVIRDHPGTHPLMSGVLAPVLPNEAARGAEPGERPPPETLPAWYDMDKAMAPQHLTNFTLPSGFAPATGLWGADAQ